MKVVVKDHNCFKERKSRGGVEKLFLEGLQAETPVVRPIKTDAKLRLSKEVFLSSGHSRVMKILAFM